VQREAAVGHEKGDLAVVVGQREEVGDLGVKVAVELEREVGEVVDADLWLVVGKGGGL
jgi:hypothetical protein